MVYSDRQFETVKFMLERGEVMFDSEIEESALVHMIEIFKYIESEKFNQEQEYLKGFKEKFRNWKKAEQRLIVLTKEQKNQHINMKMKELFGIDILADDINL